MPSASASAAEPLDGAALESEHAAADEMDAIFAAGGAASAAGGGTGPAQRSTAPRGGSEPSQSGAGGAKLNGKRRAKAKAAKLAALAGGEVWSPALQASLGRLR